MQESHGEGLATHIGPGSCAGTRERAGEALTGGSAGRVLSREIHDPLRGADVVEVGGRPHRARRYREARPDPARSKTLRMHPTAAAGNREIPRSSGAEGSPRPHREV
jgi:hypothetical protein